MRRVVVAIVKRIEIAEAGHEDKPSGCYARNKIEAEEQPFPIDINVTVLLVPLAIQREKRTSGKMTAGRSRTAQLQNTPSFW